MSSDIDEMVASLLEDAARRAGTTIDAIVDVYDNVAVNRIASAEYHQQQADDAQTSRG